MDSPNPLEANPRAPALPPPAAIHWLLVDKWAFHSWQVKRFCLERHTSWSQSTGQGPTYASCLELSDSRAVWTLEGKGQRMIILIPCDGWRTFITTYPWETINKVGLCQRKTIARIPPSPLSCHQVEESKLIPGPCDWVDARLWGGGVIQCFPNCSAFISIRRRKSWRCLSFKNSSSQQCT